MTNITSQFGTRKLISNLIQRYSDVYRANSEEPPGFLVGIHPLLDLLKSLSVFEAFG